ncbi:MAG: DUF6691 family protein [bacterium]|jgi:uncharacterized membrane protein YedE/YeeE
MNSQIQNTAFSDIQTEQQTSEATQEQKDAKMQYSNQGRASQLLLGALFGFIFGFLLQKGGVTKYEILIGVLLLRDFTVFKVMLSAVMVGMAGVYTLYAMGKVELKIKPVRLGGNIIGGLIFGVGFGLAGYCPGTTSAAFGQGNYDAAVVMLGMLTGSWLYAELSGWLSRTVESWGNKGKIVLPELFHMRLLPFMVLYVTFLAALLVILDQLD